jgi:hypothetical protein
MDKAARAMQIARVNASNSTLPQAILTMLGGHFTSKKW